MIYSDVDDKINKYFFSIVKGPTIAKNDSGFGNNGSSFANFADFDNKVGIFPQHWHVGNNPTWRW